MARGSKKQVRRRKLTLERLNERICLAVTATLDGGVLTVNGTPEDDAVLIRDDGQGTVIVRDLDAGTTQKFEGVPDDLSIMVTTGDGDDRVVFRRDAGSAPLPTLQFDLGSDASTREASDADTLDIRIAYDRKDADPQTLELDIATGDGDDDVGIALLLPAVQKVREAAARVSVDLGEGQNSFDLKSRGVDTVDLDLTSGEDDDAVRIALLLPAVQKVREAASLEPDVQLDILTNGGDDDVVVGLLLPAVQKVREAAARASVDLGEGQNSLNFHSAGVGKVDLDLTSGDGDDQARIGLLLPAVQKVAEDANAEPDVQLDILTNGGDDDVVVGLLLPAVQKVREAAARATVDLGDGQNGFDLHSAGVGNLDLDLTAGDDDDAILIGLLLPAVQKVREAASTEPDVQLDILTNGGDDDVVVGLLLPAVQKVRDAAARTRIATTVDLGAGDDQFRLHGRGAANIVTDVQLGDGDDEATIALLLPAVQKVRDAAARTTVDAEDGAGGDTVQVQVRGYQTVETTISSDEGDTIVDRSPRLLRPLR